MNKLYISALAIGFSVAVNVADAADFSSYSSRAALIGQPQETTIGVLAEGTATPVEHPVATPTAGAADYSSKVALLGHPARTTDVAAAPSAGTVVYNTKVALRGARTPSIELAPLK